MEEEAAMIQGHMRRKGRVIDILANQPLTAEQQHPSSWFRD